MLFANDAAAHLAAAIDIPSLRLAAAFGGLFLVTLLIGGLVGILAGRLVHYTGLIGTDRFLGALFGLMRGAAVVTALVLAAGLTPLPQDPRGSSRCCCTNFSKARSGCGISCRRSWRRTFVFLEALSTDGSIGRPG